MSQPARLTALPAPVRDPFAARWPLASTVADRERGPLPHGTPGAVLRRTAEVLGEPRVPSTGVGESAALDLIAGLLSVNGIDLSHPHAAAHLQPPVLQVAVDADALASASNASMDTYDSGPATLAIEQWVVKALAGLAGFGPSADGVLTPGGSISNLLAVLIARDSAAAAAGIDVRRDGVQGLLRPVVFCSELAHFSVQRACAALGLGEQAVVTIPSDEDFRLRIDVLEAELAVPGRTPVAVVATAGTTDFGSIDPIAPIAALARAHGVWLHVDAAYGFGALFSDRLAPLLAEVSLADSVTLDLHKIGWQPAATSVLLVADRKRFSAFDRSVDYLNPADDIDSGLDGLLGRSLQTTRRPDAVKVATTLTAYGRAGLGTMLDTCHELAHAAAARIVADSNLELLAPVTLTTVLFRIVRQGLPDLQDVPDRRDLRDVPDGRDLRDLQDLPDGQDLQDVLDGRDLQDVLDGRDLQDVRDGRDRRNLQDGRDVRDLPPAELDALQGEVRRRLLTSGRVLIGRTKVPARGGRPAAVALKLTLLNPNATATDIEDLLDQVVATALDVLTETGEGAA